jgi:membrane protein involved in colicin uptake
LYVTHELGNLPEDSEALKALVRSLVLECDRETKRAEQQQRFAKEQQRRAEEQQRLAEEQQRLAEEQQAAGRTTPR